MNPVVSIFKYPPDGGRGYHRDMRVRWALEEVGQPYTLRHLTFSEMRCPEYLEMQPFGQMPADAGLAGAHQADQYDRTVEGDFGHWRRLGGGQ